MTILCFVAGLCYHVIDYAVPVHEVKTVVITVDGTIVNDELLKERNPNATAR